MYALLQLGRSVVHVAAHMFVFGVKWKKMDSEFEKQSTTPRNSTSTQKKASDISYTGWTEAMTVAQCEAMRGVASITIPCVELDQK